MALLGWIALLVRVGALARMARVRRLGFMVASGWLSLPLYNYWVLAGCQGDCGIRIDLLLVAPVLLIITGVWLVSWWRLRRGGDR